MAAVSAFLSGFGIWFWQNAKTKRQAKKEATDNYSTAINQLVENINSLVEQNREVVARLVEEQDKVFSLQKERSELLDKVDRLQKTVECLTRKLDKYIKNEKVSIND